MRNVFRASLAVAAMLVVPAFPAAAQMGQGVQIGRLSCELAPSFAFIVSSAREMTCRFVPTGNRGGEVRLKGQAQRYGLDIGFNGRSVLVWNVFAPTSQTGAEALRGSYLGVSGNASSGTGSGGSTLSGGHGGSITLQPVSVSSHTGLNLGFGLTRFTLR